MPQLAFATSFFEEYERLEKPIRQAVRDAMAQFQKLTVGELYSQGKTGLHLERIVSAKRCPHSYDPYHRVLAWGRTRPRRWKRDLSPAEGDAAR